MSVLNSASMSSAQTGSYMNSYTFHYHCVCTSLWRGSSLQPSAQTTPPHGCLYHRTASPSASADPWRSADNLYAYSFSSEEENVWLCLIIQPFAYRSSPSFPTWLSHDLPPVVEGDSSGGLLLAEKGWRLHFGVAEAQVLMEIIEPIDKVAYMTAEHLKVKDDHV